MANKLTDEQFYAQMDKIKQLSGYNPLDEIDALNTAEYGVQQPPTQQPVADTSILGLMERGEGVVGDFIGGLLGGPASNWRNNLQQDTNVNPYVAGKDVLNQANVNFLDSAKTSLGGGADLVANPKQTVQSIADLSSGALQHALPDSMSWNEDDKAMASMAGQQIKEDWTTAEGFQKMLAERPAEVFPAFYGAGILGKIAGRGARDVLNSEAVLSKVEPMSRAIDPLNLGPSSNMVEPGINPKTGIDNAGFYSEAENVLNKLKQETNHPDHIKQFMQKNGVTKTEMQDTGLLPYLDTAKANDDRVTKTGLLSFINENKGTHDEVVLSGGLNDDMFKDLHSDMDWETADNEWLDDYVDSRSDNISYDLLDGERAYQADWFDMAKVLNLQNPTRYPETRNTRLAKVDQELVALRKERDVAFMDNLDRKDEFTEKLTTLETEKQALLDAPSSHDTWEYTLHNQLADAGGIGGMFESDNPNAQQIKYDIEDASRELALREYRDDPVQFKRIKVGGQKVDIYKDQDGYYHAFDEGNSHYSDRLFDSNEITSTNEMEVQLREHFDLSDEGSTMHSSFTQPGADLDTYDEFYVTSDMVAKSGGYSNSAHHGDIEDVSLHFRTTVRQDKQGNDVLFLEEVQSDLHQEARKKKVGYTNEANTVLSKALKKQSKADSNFYKARDEAVAKYPNKEVQDLKKRLEEIVKERDEPSWKSAYQIKDATDSDEQAYNSSNMYFKTNDEWTKKNDTYQKELQDKHAPYAQAVQERDKVIQNIRDAKHNQLSSISDSPMKNDRWIEAGLEKAIQKAKEKGINRVAWTTPQQQVDTWSDSYEKLYQTLYGDKLPGAAERIAKKYGSTTGKTDIDFTRYDVDYERTPFSNNQEVNYIDINDRMNLAPEGISSYGSTSVPKPEKVKGGLLDQASNSYVKTLMKHDGYTGTIADYKKNFVSEGLLKQEPLTVYRSSTSGSYDKFDKSKQKSATLGQGVYMFDNEKDANNWVGGNLQKIELPYDYMEKSINWGDGGQSDFVTKAFKKIEKEVDFKLDLEDGGIDVYPELVKKLGDDKAQALLSKHGIYGNRRDKELTIFNVDDAKIISTDKKKPKNGLLD